MLQVNLQVHLTTGDTASILTDNIAELHNALGYLQSIGALRGPVPQPANTNVGSGEDAQQTPGPVTGEKEAAPEKPKRQSRKAPSAAGSAAPAAASEATEPTSTAKATSKDEPKVKIEEVTAAVTELANATSLLTARAVLEKFGVKRAAELKAEQYADFLAACKAAMSGSDGEADSAEDVL